MFISIGIFIFTFQPRLGPKPFTPPKLQTFSNVDKMPPAEPTIQERGIFPPVTTESRGTNFEKLPKSSCGEVECAYGDIGNASDYEKLPSYESGLNDFSKLTESDKVYEKNDLEKICNKTNELNFNYDKIENEIEKPLKKVPNVDEISDLAKKKSKEKNDGDEGENEKFIPRTPSMAERRKLFETARNHSDEKDLFDGLSCSKSSESLREDESFLERGTAQRNSIAGQSDFPKPVFKTNN